MGRSPLFVRWYAVSGGICLSRIGDTALRDATPAMIQGVIDDIAQTGVSASTLRGSHRALRAIINYGVRIGAMVPVATRTDLPRQGKHDATILAPAEVQRLLDSLRSEGCMLYYPVALSATCALRKGEALGLRWADIDWDAGAAHIRCNLTCTTGMTILKRVNTTSHHQTQRSFCQHSCLPIL